jgi:DNA-binding FadR family transcriptional regulator
LGLDAPDALIERRFSAYTGENRIRGGLVPQPPRQRPDAGSFIAEIAGQHAHRLLDRLLGPSVGIPRLALLGPLVEVLLTNLPGGVTSAPAATRRRLRVQRREPVLRSSRAERVAADLEHEILSARLPVGAHLGRRSEIMDRFGISPTVMNETLRILRDRDLVSVRPGPGGGITVASAPPQVRVGALELWFQPSTPHPLDLFEARLYLEFGLTKAAFERATSEDIAAMRSAMVTLRASTEAEQFFDAVLAFHRVVAAAAHIPVLEGMHQLILTSIKAVLTRVLFVGDHEPLLASSLGVHDDIVAAIALHDQASFVDAINRHDKDLIRADDPDRTPDTPQHP